MRSRIQIHSPVKIAACVLGCSLLVVLALTLLKQWIQGTLYSPEHQINSSGVVSESFLELRSPPASDDLLLPVIDLEIADASTETNWSASLARALNGQTEATIDGGRVDVLTRIYAIEVDRLDKWHEGIGQAAHYALVTKAIPVVALIVPSKDWPLSEKTKA